MRTMVQTNHDPHIKLHALTPRAHSNIPTRTLRSAHICSTTAIIPALNNMTRTGHPRARRPMATALQLELYETRLAKYKHKLSNAAQQTLTRSEDYRLHSHSNSRPANIYMLARDPKLRIISLRAIPIPANSAQTTTPLRKLGHHHPVITSRDRRAWVRSDTGTPPAAQ